MDFDDNIVGNTDNNEDDDNEQSSRSEYFQNVDGNDHIQVEAESVDIVEDAMFEDLTAREDIVINTLDESVEVTETLSEDQSEKPSVGIVEVFDADINAINADEQIGDLSQTTLEENSVAPDHINNHDSVQQSEERMLVTQEQLAQEQTKESQNALKSYSSDITFGSDIDSNDASIRKKGRMGDLMISMGLIDEDQLNVALQEKKKSGKLLGQIFVELGFILEEQLLEFLSKSSGFEVFEPKDVIVDGDALAMMEKPEAVKHCVLPVRIEGQDLVVAMADPYDVVALDTLRKNLPKGMQIKPLVSSANILSEAIDAAYGYSSAINAILQELEDGEVKDVASLKEEEAYSHPIVRLVNALVADAVKIGASDIHFEPEENFIRLRYRVDGVLFTAQTLHKNHWNGISQRIKILCNMNIADKINMQDGRFGLQVNGKDIDFRVSSLPTVFGENIVLRILDKSSSIMPLSSLGFSEHNKNLISKAQKRPEGIIIVTGPTGSGKTTSLYSMLNEINTVDVNIQTLEDPVEYSLPMIRQTHVREGILDFADGIKALLRQDPDIIFIGEVRDKTTAEMALKAAMTGHQVYTTLHTNDSFGAIPRLLDLGLKPGMIAGAIVSVFAQRLGRRLCQNCKEEYTPDPEECELLNLSPDENRKVFRAHQGGCGACGGTGYKGRVAIAEILSFNEEMDDVMAAGANKAELKAAALRNGFQSMKDDGILKILEGVTDLAALSKVVNVDK